MNKYHIVIVIMLLACISCNLSQTDAIGNESTPACGTKIDQDSLAARNSRVHNIGQGALLGTRFKSFEELQSVIRIEYVNDNAETDTAIHGNSMVRVTHCSNGQEVISLLASGITQGDIAHARDGDIRNRIAIAFVSPFAVSNRKDLERVFLLARVRPYIFGEGDVAFFNLAQASVRNINTAELAFVNSRDTTEKGYLNTFNHITAQAFITSCFSEELADFVADAHERYHHPELILGKFTEQQINDLDEGPVDNYVDIINNEWGQELGKRLKKKYNINRRTRWTPEIVANYLNDLQQYYSWAFQIGFEPFKPECEQVTKFASKLNVVMNTKPFDK